MEFCRIIVCVTVKKDDCECVTEEMENCLDGLARQRIAIFNCDVSSATVCAIDEADEAEEMMREVARK